MRDDGFTLLELLVALAVFAVMSVMAYEGLQAMLDSQGLVRQESERLAGLQKAFVMLGRDVVQAAPRSVRDEYEDPLPAMFWQDLDPLEPGIEFTRNGWRNPGGMPGRSSLQRVAYHLVDGSLERWRWPVLDRAIDSVPIRQEVLSGVRGFSVAFLDDQGQWLDGWPAGDLDENPALLTLLPRAVRFVVDVEGWGVIERQYVLVGPGGGKP